MIRDKLEPTFCLFETLSHCLVPGWPGTQFVDWIGLELTDLTAFATSIGGI